MDQVEAEIYGYEHVPLILNDSILVFFRNLQLHLLDKITAVHIPLFTLISSGRPLNEATLRIKKAVTRTLLIFSKLSSTLLAKIVQVSAIS